MSEIGKFSLKNGGGFVTRLEFKYVDSKGNKIHKKGTGNITLGCTKTADPGDYGVPDGATVMLFAFVKLGVDKEANQQFTYRKYNNTVANYVITGTTLNNSLGFIGFSDFAVCCNDDTDESCVKLTDEQKAKIINDLNSPE